MPINRPIREVRNKPAPPAKWVIRDKLLAELYKPVEAARDDALCNLIKRNSTLLQSQDIKEHGAVQDGHEHLSFAYNGKFYTMNGHGPIVRNKVMPELLAEVREWSEYYEVQVLTEEKTRISGFLDSVFSFSPAAGDWLALVPDAFQAIMRSVIITPNWEPMSTPEAHAAFLAKHQARFDLIRQRLAFNLIS